MSNNVRRIIAAIGASAAFAVAVPAFAATISLSPSTGNFNIGQTITVNVLLNTQGDAVDGTDLRYLTYNPSLLEVVDSDAQKSGVQITPGSLMTLTASNSVDVTNGNITFSQITSGGTRYVNTTDSVLAIIQFKVKASGNASLVVQSTPGVTTDSNVAVGGKDVLATVNNAMLTLGTPSGTPPGGLPSFEFNKNLQSGTRSGDVMQLQKFLNAIGFTIAASGPGSPGSETSFFGGLTKLAVIKFQEAYKSEILTPNGLSKGTGYFGPSTRKKVNQLGMQGGDTPGQQCSQEAKMCPDGSAVGRTGPNCEFAACPSSANQAELQSQINTLQQQLQQLLQQSSGN